MAAKLEEFSEVPEPDNSMFRDITLDDFSYTTFNDVMIEVRKCIHEGLPRYTLLTFRQANSEFSCHTNYYQGVMNYCLAFACLSVLSLIIIAIYLLVQEDEDEDNVSPEIMKRYRMSLTASAIFVFLFAFIALAGIVLVQIKWRQINSKYANSGLESVEYFYKALTTINVTIFKELEKYRATVTQLSIHSVAQSQASRIAQRIANAAGRAYQAIKKQMRKSVSHLLKQVEEARVPMKKLLTAIAGAITALKAFKVAEIIFLCGGFVVTLWTMGISFMMLRGAFNRCDTELTYMCRLACCTLVVWWFVAVLTLPAAIALADFCYTPRESGAEFTHFYVSELPEQLVYYYLSCDGENPIAIYLSILAGVFYAMTMPFVAIFTKLKSVGVNESEQVVQALHFTKNLLNEALLNGCVKSKFLYDQASYETCNHVLLGLVLVAFAAPFIGLLLTFYVVVALKVRDLIEQSKDDICIHTEEGSETKKHEEPDICDPRCVRGEPPNIDRYHEEICPSSDTIRQKKEKTTSKVVQLKNALGGVWRSLAKGDQPEPTKSFQVEKVNKCSTSAVCSPLGGDEREKTANKVVQLKNALGGVWRSLAKGDQPEPTKSCQEKTTSKVVQLKNALGGVWRSLTKGDQPEPTKSIHVEKVNKCSTSADCPALGGDERSAMPASREKTASKVVKNKICPTLGGVWRSLVKGDQSEPTESREEETASKVVQVDKKVCPVPGGACRNCRKVEREKKNEDAFCPPLDEDERSVMPAPGGMGAEDID